MMERYLNLSLGREPSAPRETVADTLATIWTRVLYGAA
jgi:TetR/AcrR family transcriptional regulator, ethionamide resistance regulator